MQPYLCNAIKRNAMNEQLRELCKNGANVSVTVTLAELEQWTDELVEKAIRKIMEANDSKPLLSSTEVCTLLGVDRTTLWRWNREDYLKPVRIGGKIRYKKSDIDALLS